MFSSSGHLEQLRAEDDDVGLWVRVVRVSRVCSADDIGCTPSASLCGHNNRTMARLDDLTPIRVRGRRVRRPEESKKVFLARSRSRSRAPQSRSLSTAPSKRRKLEAVDVEDGQQTRRLSHLESLPAELIERIFLDCLEFNLPRASPALSASLSRERLYRVLILYALWNDPVPRDHGTPSARAVERLFRPLDYVPIELNERCTLQMAVLECRWFTLERLKGCLPDFVNLSLHRWFYGRGKHANGLRIEKSDMDAITGALEYHAFSWIPHKKKKNGELDYVSCHKGVDAQCWQLAPQVQSVYATETLRYPLAAVTFPDKLLRGDAWTDEKLALFEFFRGCLSGSFVNDTHAVRTHARSGLIEDKIQDGIHAAIVEQNPRALFNLLELDNTYSAYFSGQPDLAGITRAVQSHNFLTAVHTSDDPAIMKLLVRACPELIPCDDPEITEWAMRLDEKGDPFAKFLLRLMEVLPTLIRRIGGNNFMLDGAWPYDKSVEETRLYIEVYGHPRALVDELLRPDAVEPWDWNLDVEDEEEKEEEEE